MWRNIYDCDILINNKIHNNENEKVPMSEILAKITPGGPIIYLCYVKGS